MSVTEQPDFLERDLPEAMHPEDFWNDQIVWNALRTVDWDFTTYQRLDDQHNMHPYPAKFIPLLPRNLIRFLSLRGELVLDPFGGGGTTALEASRLGRRTISLDANPLSYHIGRAKTQQLGDQDFHTLRALDAAVRSTKADLTLGPDPTHRLQTQYHDSIPSIPHIDKWFHPQAVAELAYLKHAIDFFVSDNAKDLAWVALSRTVSKVSNQESETRYTAKPKDIVPGSVLQTFIHILRDVMLKAPRDDQGQYANFQIADATHWNTWNISEESVALIVTSPPYPNAYDYHLYHRFRLFWLGYRPDSLRTIEIGSHLRHQSLHTGFPQYLEEMRTVLENSYRSLQPGRYAIFVVGNGVYDGEEVDTARALRDLGTHSGFTVIGTIHRHLPILRRSVTQAARRLESECLVVFRKPDRAVSLTLFPPNYRLWPYENILRVREIASLLHHPSDTLDETPDAKISLRINSAKHLATLRNLTFTHGIQWDHHVVQPTWQALLEKNGDPKGGRKEPKYVTHGIHPYKGKFYPQLAKSLMNLSELDPESSIFDPFMGSGTVILEALLNGHVGFGIDLNPLAALIAQAKVQSLAIDLAELTMLTDSLQSKAHAFQPRLSWGQEWDPQALSELMRWFPNRVLDKISWLRHEISQLGSTPVENFFFTCLSSIIRSVSLQDPKDLRIRRRKDPFDDAPVFERFFEQVQSQLRRLDRLHRIAGHTPHQTSVAHTLSGDSRMLDLYEQLGIRANSIDAIITSPPYATALPYLDTDRLSLLVLFGLHHQQRTPLEKLLIGSREISQQDKRAWESDLEHWNPEGSLPKAPLEFLTELKHRVDSDPHAGFRRHNMPSLLLRYFSDMAAVVSHMYRVLKPGRLAWIVIGDNRITLHGETLIIPTTALLHAITEHYGFITTEYLDISVTQENLRHNKHAITRNMVLQCRKSDGTPHGSAVSSSEQSLLTTLSDG